MPIPLSLQSKLRDGHVVPFVGAGVSMSVLDRMSGQPVFPNWRQLLQAAADRLEQETKKEDAQLVRLFLTVNPPEFLEAASPEIANSLSNLGTWYGEQGDSRALAYSEQALAMRRALFGEIHPDIANSLHNVGARYSKQGDLRRGLDYSQQAFDMYKELLDDRHPSTIEAARQLAIIFVKLNRRKEAYMIS